MEIQMVGGKTATNNQFATATRCDARNPRKVGRKLLSAGSFYAQIEPFALDDDDDNDDNDSMIDFPTLCRQGVAREAAQIAFA